MVAPTTPAAAELPPSPPIIFGVLAVGSMRIAGVLFTRNSRNALFSVPRKLMTGTGMTFPVRLQKLLPPVAPPDEISMLCPFVWIWIFAPATSVTSSFSKLRLVTTWLDAIFDRVTAPSAIRLLTMAAGAILEVVMALFVTHPAISANREKGAGVSGWRGASVLYGPVLGPGRTPISSHRPLPSNIAAPKSSDAVNSPLLTARSL